MVHQKRRQTALVYSFLVPPFFLGRWWQYWFKGIVSNLTREVRCRVQEKLSRTAYYTRYCCLLYGTRWVSMPPIACSHSTTLHFLANPRCCLLTRAFTLARTAKVGAFASYNGYICWAGFFCAKWKKKKKNLSKPRFLCSTRFGVNSHIWESWDTKFQEIQKETRGMFMQIR